MKRCLLTLLLATLLFIIPGCSSTPQPAPDKTDAQAANELSNYLSQNFSSAAWYSAVEKAEVKTTSDGQKYAVIYTKLAGLKESQPEYAAIFIAVSNSPLSLSWVDVLDHDGDYLVKHSELVRFPW